MIAILLLVLFAGISRAQGVAVQASEPFRFRPSQAIEKAAVASDTDEVKRLFTSARPEARYGALDIALRKKDLELAEWLLRQGVHPTANPPWQYDALGSAAEAGNIPAIELLCRYKADANKPGFFNARPLHQAINSQESNRLETVRALLACGADPRIRDQELYRESGKPGLQPGNDPTLVDALHTRDTELVRLLLDHGAAVEESADCCAEKLLIIAVHQPEMFKLLLERGGAKTIPGPIGAKLLGYVVCAGHPEQEVTLTALRTLLAHKAPVNDWYNGDTPLMCAAERVEVEVVKLLLDAGADARVAQPHGRRDTAVAEAIDAYDDPRDLVRRFDISEGKVKDRALKVVKLIIDHGVSPGDDEEIWRAARRDDDMGRLLTASTQAWYANLVRECLASAPRVASTGLKPTPPASAPGRIYSLALINVLDKAPVPLSRSLTFSPDGRWMAYEVQEGSEVLLQSLASNKTYRFSDSGHLDWSADGKALGLGRGESVVNLAADPPGVIPRKDFVTARRPGDAPCVGWHDDGAPWPKPDRPESGEFALSPDLSIRYHIVALSPTRHALVAEKNSRQEQLLVHDVADEFRKGKEKQKAMVEKLARKIEAEGGDGKKVREGLKMLGSHEPTFEVGDLLLSPTGRFLSYSTTADRPIRDDQKSQQLVVDLKARPVRVWEVDAAVHWAVWHPNGRELWFVTDFGAETGPPMRRERAQRLAVVVFPE